MRKKLALMILFSIMAALPVASAYWYGGYGSSFLFADLLNNEWVIFTVLFAIFYTTIYASLGRVFKENKAVPAVLALALSFLVTAGIQRDWVLLEKPIMFWALILTIALVLLTFFRAMQVGPAALFGLIALLIGLWPTTRSSAGIGAISSMPYGLVSFLDAITSPPWGTIIFIVGIVMTATSLFKSLSNQPQR